MKKQNNILSDDYVDFKPKKPKIRHFKSKQVSFSELDNEDVQRSHKKPFKYANKNY